MPLALVFDQMVFVTMLVFGFMGFFAGLFRSLLDIVAIIVGLVAAIAATASPDIVRFVMEQTGSPNERYNKSVLIVVVFIGTQLLVALVGWISMMGVDSELTYGDRLLGGAVGASRGFVLFVVFFLVNVVGYHYAGMGKLKAPPGSISYPAVRVTGQAIINSAVPFLPDDIAAVVARVKL